MTLHRILFVDDDPNILHGLQRMLRSLRDQWDVRFALSGQVALEMLEHETYDAIVSDMRMPDMDGAELLSFVSSKYPAMLRVILSGYSDPQAVMRTIGPAHQYLAKPCRPQVLLDVLSRTIELHRLLEADGLRRLLAGLRTLPTPPAIYFTLMDYIANPNASMNGVAELIERDMAMTAELLKLTNSAYFTLPCRIATPLQAVRILGFETLRALVLRIGIFRNFHGHAGTAHLIEAINADGFLVARLARRIAQAEHLDSRAVDEAICAGMLGSIGTLVLLDHLPEAFAKVAALIADGDDPLDAETAVFGANHMQLGAYLLGLWGFPKSVVEAVAFAGQPGVAPVETLDTPVIVHIARVLAGPLPAYARQQSHPELGRLALDMRYLERLGCADRLPVWMAEAQVETAGAR
jgi:HD-like signal output (HDOD) protein/CheY-like chemotaxis protein